VPAVLVRGGTLDERDAAIARLAEPADAENPIAVLRTGGGMFGGGGASLGPHVVVKRAPAGCACCTGAVLFRVALLGLLRSSSPARLVVELGPDAHVETLEAQLQGGSLGRSLRLVGRVDLDAAPGLQALTWPAGGP